MKKMQKPQITAVVEALERREKQDIVLDVVGILGNKFENRNSFFNNTMREVCSRALVEGRAGLFRDGAAYAMNVLDSNESLIGAGGMTMETVDAMMKKINEEVGESSKLLKKAVNEMKATYDILMPDMVKMVKDIRSSRMTVTMELKQSLTIMKDVRKFFLDSDYKTEMERLEKFVLLGERMQRLLKDGTMDAVCDIILKLSIGNEESEE